MRPHCRDRVHLLRQKCGGQVCPNGGWGHLIDDGGSGYALGRDALAAVVRQWDGRGGATVLSELIPAQLGTGAPQELTACVYSGDKSRIAALAPLMGQAAGQGDKAALNIYERACDGHSGTDGDGARRSRPAGRPADPRPVSA